MPTYVYEREDGSRFDHVQSIHDDALTEDPETGEPVNRIIPKDSMAVREHPIYAVDGFHTTDYVRDRIVPESAPRVD